MSWGSRPRVALAIAIYGSVALVATVISQSVFLARRNDSAWVGVISMTPTLFVCVLMWLRAAKFLMTKLLTIYCLSTLTSMLIEVLQRWELWRTGSELAHEITLEKTGLFGALASLPWWVGTLPMIPLMMVAFPDGVPRLGFWRKVYFGQVISIVLLLPVLINQNQTRMNSLIQALGAVVGTFIFLSAITRAIYLVVAWLRGDAEKKRSLRSFVFAAATIVACYFAMGVVKAVFPHDTSVWINDVLIFAVISMALPIGLTFGILRDRLYGIEIFISRALVGTLMTFMVFGIFFTSTGLIAFITGKEGGISWASLAGLALVVAILTPLYRFVSFAVERVLYGDREKPELIAHRIISSFQSDGSEEEFPKTIVRTLQESLKFPYMELNRITKEGEEEIHSSGVEINTTEERFDITWSGENIATLRVFARNGERTISNTDRQILQSLIPVISTALFVTRATDEVLASRERLVDQVTAERERLRRALHDSISPTLAGISLAAATAKSLTWDDPRHLTLLNNIETGSSSGIHVLEALLEDLRPPGLAELGLLGAINELVERLCQSTSISFITDDLRHASVLEPKSEEVAFIAISEALINVARHSKARTCFLSSASSGEMVTFTVIDDGTGPGNGIVYGTGLESISTRVAQRNGNFNISANSPQGCRVDISLPRWRTIS